MLDKISGILPILLPVYPKRQQQCSISFLTMSLICELIPKTKRKSEGKNWDLGLIRLDEVSFLFCPHFDSAAQFKEQPISRRGIWGFGCFLFSDLISNRWSNNFHHSKPWLMSEELRSWFLYSFVFLCPKWFQNSPRKPQRRRGLMSYDHCICREKIFLVTADWWVVH